MQKGEKGSQREKAIIQRFVNIVCLIFFLVGILLVFLLAFLKTNDQTANLYTAHLNFIFVDSLMDFFFQLINHINTYA